MRVRIKLSYLLAERGLSQREFAKITGIRFPSISDMCRNEIKRLPLDNLAKICETLNVNISDILELVEDEDVKSDGS